MFRTILTHQSVDEMGGNPAETCYVVFLFYLYVCIVILSVLFMKLYCVNNTKFI